jgi:hypothetical protein
MTKMSKTLRSGLAALGILLACSLAGADGGETRLEGTIRNAAGQPVPECRVIARALEQAEFFVSPPSDERGRYTVEVPANGSYVLVALVSPTGARFELPEADPLAVQTAPVSRDVTIPMPIPPDPRGSVKNHKSVDRLFLSFVEDPALVHRRHYEAQVDYEEPDFANSTVLRGIVAFQFESMPRVEVGARLGYGNLEIDGFADGSGMTDLDVWGKFHIKRSADNRMDMALGAIATLPTGDSDSGLGRDALQSKIFFGASYAWKEVLLVANAGIAAAENGEAFGVPLEGKTAPAVGIGVLLPFMPGISVVFEANYEGELFEDTKADSNLLTGVNWQLQEHGKLRLAVSLGLGETSDLAEIIAGYAFVY